MGGPSEFSKHLDKKARFSQSSCGDVKREKELCVQCRLSVLWRHLLLRNRRHPRYIGRFSKAPLFVSFCECSALFVSSHGMCEEIWFHMAREQHVMDALILCVTMNNPRLHKPVLGIVGVKHSVILELCSTF